MIPLPRPIALLLERGEASNLSLVRDRGATYQPGEKPKQPEIEHDKEFLARFVARFNASKAEYFAEFRRRRLKALESVAHCLTLKTRSRLVIGLGLPQSGKENTSLLLDRLTGCPYIPGSSVKGLARHAAREVAEGWLDGDRQFWSENHVRLFGSQSQASPSEGAMVFYDAFPTTWPPLELDVLTPHYKKYYETAGAVPGDWENPVPIQFVVVKRGRSFDFVFRGLDMERRAADEEQTARLLTTALDWLGVGGKKSSGYGSFEPPVTKPSSQKIVKWEDAQVTWIPNKGKLRITSGSRSFEAPWQGLISEEEKGRVKASRRPIPADVEAREVGNLFEAVKIRLK